MIVKPIGLNLKKNDRVVEDGFLRECVNLQWRDGSFKPIPERLLTSIDASMYSDIVGHKVADEDRINLLGFYNGDGDNPFLAQNVAEWLGGAGAVYGGRHRSRHAHRSGRAEENPRRQRGAEDYRLR